MGRTYRHNHNTNTAGWKVSRKARRAARQDAKPLDVNALMADLQADTHAMMRANAAMLRK